MLNTVRISPEKKKKGLFLTSVLKFKNWLAIENTKLWPKHQVPMAIQSTLQNSSMCNNQTFP